MIREKHTFLWLLGVCILPILGCGASSDSDFQLSIDEAARSVPSAAELNLIAKTGLPFQRSARLLNHFSDEHEGYESWLLLCPSGTQPLNGEHGNIPIEDSLASVASLLKTRSIGKPRMKMAHTYEWKNSHPWRATVTYTNCGDYVQVERTRDFSVPRARDETSP